MLLGSIRMTMCIPDWFRKLKEVLVRDSPNLILFDYYTDYCGRI